MVFLVLIIPLVLFLSCSSPEEHSTHGEVLDNHYAEYFTVKEIDSGYIVSTYDASRKKIDFLLTRTDSQRSKNIINIPVKRVVALSSTHCAFIETLGKEESLKGVSGKNYIYSKTIRSFINNGDVVDVGYENRIDHEKVLSLKPDVIFAYAVDPESQKSLEKFYRLDIPVFFVNEFIEPEILGRTEWIKLFGAFYDELSFAEYYFDSIREKYYNIKNIAKTSKNDPPKVLSSMPWKGVWWAPGGNSYFAKLINDAGGDYIFSDNSSSSSRPYSIEEVFSLAKNIDIWLNPNDYNSKYGMHSVDSRLSSFDPYNEALIYNNNNRVNRYGGNDFWESGIVNPHIILQDLVKIFHPDINHNHELYYYKRLF